MASALGGVGSGREMTGVLAGGAGEAGGVAIAAICFCSLMILGGRLVVIEVADEVKDEVSER
jgi:hypothetical protein